MYSIFINSLHLINEDEYNTNRYIFQKKQTKSRIIINLQVQIIETNKKGSMFSDFQNMFDKIKNTVKQQVNKPQQDYANTPQKYTIGGRQINQLKLLSQGAFGFIWLAEDARTKEQFALKRVICQTEERLRESKKEKDVMSVLPKCKNIVEFFGGEIVSRDNQRIVITLMELCDGGTLFDLLEKRENKGFTQQQLIKITLQILLGLQAMHTTGYYHRDIKIQNILFGKDKNYKLCDFGSCTKQTYDFSQISKKDYDSIKEDIEGMTTPMYRPPQIVDPYLKYLVNHKTDIWMTGCVLFTLGYFIHPFVDSNAIGIASGTYRFPKYPSQTKYQVSQKIKDLIRHMLTPNPAFRPSAKQLIELLKNWDNITQVPLNSEAVRRKKEELIKEQQLEQLNKKCVDFEGDIPIQKILELQRKLKKPQTQERAATFVNKRQIKDQNEYLVKVQPNNSQNDPFGANTFTSNVSKKTIENSTVVNNEMNGFNAKDPFASMSGKQVQPKKQTNINELWGGFSQNPPKTQTNDTNPKSNSNSFDFFNSFGNKPTKPIQQKQTQNTVNFQQMFSQTPVTFSSPHQGTQINNQKKPFDNLLDF